MKGEKNQFSGARVTVKEIELKQGEEPFFTTIQDFKVPAVHASSIKRVWLERKDEQNKLTLFSIGPQAFSASALLPFNVHEVTVNKIEKARVPVKLQQLPLLSNTATSIHGLGETIDEPIFISEWFYEPRWIYYLLSRVTNRNFIYLRERIRPCPEIFAVFKNIQTRFNCIEKNLPPKNVHEIELAEMCEPCEPLSKKACF